MSRRSKETCKDLVSLNILHRVELKQLLSAGVLLTHWIIHLPTNTVYILSGLHLYSLSHLFHFATGEALNYRYHSLTLMYYSNSALQNSIVCLLHA